MKIKKWILNILEKRNYWKCLDCNKIRHFEYIFTEEIYGVWSKVYQCKKCGGLY